MKLRGVMPVSLNLDQQLQEGDVVQFFAYYDTSATFFLGLNQGLTAEQVTQALANLAEVTVLKASTDFLRRVAGATQIEWDITVTFHGIPWSVGQLQGDIYNALLALLNDSGAGKNLTVGPFSEIQGQAVQDNPDPTGSQNSKEAWYCNYLGIGCSGGNSTIGWSTSVGLIALALIALALVYFLKGANVGVKTS